MINGWGEIYLALPYAATDPVVAALNSDHARFSNYVSFTTYIPSYTFFVIFIKLLV